MKSEVDVLAQLWRDAKEAENHAKERRLKVESQITELLGVASEGVISAEGSEFKLKTTGRLTRTLDSEELQRDWQQLDDAIKDCVIWQPKINMKALRSLELSQSGLNSVMARYMTTKPAKPSIIVELKTNEKR